MRAMLLALLVAGCAPVAPLSGDMLRETTSVRNSIHDRASIGPVCAVVRGDPLLNNSACSRWSKTEARCEMFVVEPRSLDDTVTFADIGHEYWHCIRGKFHPESVR